MTLGSGSPFRSKDLIFLVVMIVLGIFMRLIWPSDMEWKDDEKDMFAMAQKAVETGSLPKAGMRSGGGIVNPGLSVAPFALFALFTKDPVVMNQLVQVVNVLALCCFLFFISSKIKGRDRDVWLNGLALAAVSPLAVLFSRKIWAQDMLPLISFLFLASNYYRQKGWGAFLWGLTGAVMGQIHMSGFFFAAGIFVFTVAHDHFNGFRFRWGYWLAGSMLGGITLIGWILFMRQHPQINRQSLSHAFEFSFFIYWFIDSLGINIYYSLREHFWDFIREPLLMGIPTYLMVLVHLFLIAMAALTLSKLVNVGKSFIRSLKGGALRSGKFFRNMDLTHFYLYGILLGLGVLLTFGFTMVHPHYLICAFPFQYIFLAKLFEKQKLLFRFIVLAQLIITMGFLFYIHKNGGAPQGDYGVAYHVQVLN
ncbi:MAG: hypothetical protein PSX36_09710 [bacterium]|nr:hypothetical protein [bacterium]